MRYFALALAALGSLSATLASTTTPTEHITERGVSPNPAYAFEKRQGANAVFCANVNVNFPRTVDGICALPALGTACNGISGLTVRSTLTSVISILNLTPNPLVRICLCVDATGQLTAGSVANLRTALGIQVTNVAGVNNLLQQILPTLDLTALVGPIAASLVPQAAASCVYPANSTPACSTVACDFVCNTAAFPQKCNRSCIAANAVCATGNPTRRRRTVSNDLLCSKGRSACAIPGNKYGFECLDTTTDVNSCGGCAFPLPGALKGQDCSTIPHTANVDCVGGKCIVSTCRRGFELDDNKCVEKASIAAIVEEATHAAGGLAHVVADRLVLQNAKKSIQARQVTAEQLRAQARAKRANK